MTMAADLTEAAHLSYDQCGILWNAGTLRTNFLAFTQAVIPIFDDARPNDRPVGNWLVPIAAIPADVPAETPESQAFVQGCQNLLFRICFAGADQLALGNITNTQATALLAAWNAQIGS